MFISRLENCYSYYKSDESRATCWILHCMQLKSEPSAAEKIENLSKCGLREKCRNMLDRDNKNRFNLDKYKQIDWFIEMHKQNIANLLKNILNKRFGIGNIIKWKCG